MTSEYTAANLADMENIAKKLIDELKGKIVFLNGELGAGKTTFVALVSGLLGAENQTSSPTFSIANRYVTRDIPVIHIDLYRLQTEDELEMTGFWEIIEEKATTFIEWAGKFGLKEYINNYVEIQIDASKNGARKLTVTTPRTGG